MNRTIMLMLAAGIVIVLAVYLVTAPRGTMFGGQGGGAQMGGQGSGTQMGGQGASPQK